MLKRLTSLRLNRAPNQLGVLVIYFVSSLVLAIGIAFAFWVEFNQFSTWVWLVFLTGFLAIELRPLWTHASADYVDHAASLGVCLIWAIPVFLWFDAASPESKLLLVVFYALTALCGVVLKPNGVWQTLLTVGISLPAIALILWQSNGQSLSYASIAVFASWLIAVLLGWLVGWSNAQRKQFIAERQLLLEKLEAKMQELDSARAEEQKARAVADAANTDKSKFLAMVSHDLRQPIYAASLMLDSAQQSEDKYISKSDIGQIQKSLTDLTDFLEALLDSAMLDSGELIANTSVFSLDSIAHQLRADYTDMADKNGFELNINLPPVNVSSDLVLLSRILRNLISNAIYHSGGRRIEISHVKVGNEISLLVEDDGKGLPNGLQVEFGSEPKSGEGKTSHTQAEGHGLGLSIVRRLCDLLKLTVQLDDAPTGTRFKLDGLVATPRLPPSSEHTSRPAGEQTTILLIDDDQIILDRLMALLARWGYHVHGSSGELPNINSPHLLIADLDLSSTFDGLDVVTKARAQWGERLPAFIISGNTSIDVAERVKAAGLRLVTKPIQPAALKSIILTELSQ